MSRSNKFFSFMPFSEDSNNSRYEDQRKVMKMSLNDRFLIRYNYIRATITK